MTAEKLKAKLQKHLNDCEKAETLAMRGRFAGLNVDPVTMNAEDALQVIEAALALLGGCEKASRDNFPKASGREAISKAAELLGVE